MQLIVFDSIKAKLSDKVISACYSHSKSRLLYNFYGETDYSTIVGWSVFFVLVCKISRMSLVIS